jgi:hypothetical protein
VGGIAPEKMAPGGALLENNACGHMAEPHRPEIPEWQISRSRQSRPIVNLTAAGAKRTLSDSGTGISMRLTAGYPRPARARPASRRYLRQQRNPFESEQFMARGPIKMEEDMKVAIASTFAAAMLAASSLGFAAETNNNNNKSNNQNDKTGSINTEGRTLTPEEREFCVANPNDSKCQGLGGEINQ